MNKFFSVLVSAAILATSSVAQIIPAGSTVQIHSAQNPSANLCLGAVAGTQQSEILLEPCSRNLTTFVLPDGMANTQIELVGAVSGQPDLCITALESQAGNTPVILQACSDDSFERWLIQAGQGTGQIVTTAQGALAPASCLTAVGTNQGDPVEFRPCADGANQQWTTIVV
ncbi:unnamed protein product [Peniophora sp. CBMAI 1063]|nr:unnamed protein product [Peniophora sp. CBMAI 1063]